MEEIPTTQSSMGRAIANLKKSFNFGKWDQLSETNPIKYCGGIIELKDGVVQTS